MLSGRVGVRFVLGVTGVVSGLSVARVFVGPLRRRARGRARTHTQTNPATQSRREVDRDRFIHFADALDDGPSWIAL